MAVCVGLERSRLLTHISPPIMILVAMGSTIAMWSYGLKIRLSLILEMHMLNLGQYQLMILQEQQTPHITRMWAHATLTKWKSRMRIKGIQPAATI